MGTSELFFLSNEYLVKGIHVGNAKEPWGESI
jgi:hypothetical protein